MTHKIYGLFDANGTPNGYWDDRIFPPQPNGDRNAAIPAAAVEITEAEWQELLSNPQARFVDGDIVYAKPPIGSSQYSWGSSFVEVIGSY